MTIGKESTKPPEPSRRGGRSHRKRLLVSDHPVCGVEVGFAKFS